MSRTDKTGRFRKERERIDALTVEVMGMPRSEIDMRSVKRGDMAPLLGNADYGRNEPVMSGLRYGNQRRMRAALKVSERRRARRHENEIPTGE